MPQDAGETLTDGDPLGVGETLTDGDAVGAGAELTVGDADGDMAGDVVAVMLAAGTADMDGRQQVTCSAPTSPARRWWARLPARTQPAQSARHASAARGRRRQQPHDH